MKNGYDLEKWKQISSKIEQSLEKCDKKQLDTNIRNLFNNFEYLPPNDAWDLAKKAYYTNKNYTPLNMALGIGISNNYHIIPDQDEAWDIFIKIPDNVDEIIRDKTKYFLISDLQGISDSINPLKVFNLLKDYSTDKDPEVRGEVGYTLSEYIALNPAFPTKEGWSILEKLLHDPNPKVKERTLRGLSDFYHDLPHKDVEKYGLDLLKENSKPIKEVSLDIAIQSAKEHAERREYSKASENLKIALNNLKYYSWGGIIGFIILIFFFVFLIYIVKDTWVFIFYNASYLMIVPIMISFILWKILKLDISRKMIILFSLTTFIPVLFLYPLLFVFISYLFSLTPKINIFFIIGIIVSTIFVSLIIPYQIIQIIGNFYSNIQKSQKYHLGIGLYNYFKGRKYIQFYLNSKISDEKLNYLKKAIEKFAISVKSYNKLQFGLEKELSLCPYCLNFYQGLEIYEKSFREPKKSEIKKLEIKIEKSRLILNETGDGSQTLNIALNELLKTMEILVKLKEKAKKSPTADVADKIQIDREIMEKSKEIDDIIQNINNIISEIEFHDLPLILEILRSKSDEMSYLSEKTQKGINGYNQMFLKDKYNKTGIIALLIGISALILGFYLTLIQLAFIGFFFTILSTIILGYPLIKKQDYS